MVRWTACALIAAAAHGVVGLELLKSLSVVDTDAGSPVVTLDVAPIPAAPNPSPGAPPEDEKPDAAAPQAASDALPETRPPSPDPTPSASPSEQPPPEATPSPIPIATATDPPPPAPSATPVAAPPPTPEETTPSARASPAPSPVETKPLPDPPAEASQDAASAPSVPVVNATERADVARATAGREEAEASAAIRSWERDLIAQIERHKRFPADARGRYGVASVAFAIDRTGRLTEVKLVHSSGATALDEAALDLIRRSQPFPAPPAAMSDRDLNFVAPIRYLRPGSR